MMIFKSAGTQSSMSISKSTGTVCADQSRHSTVKAVSLIIAELSATQFSMTITESTTTESANKTKHQLLSGDDFRVGRDSLLVMISESTRTVCVDHSRRQL
jgi:hypothetical protein